MVQPPVPGHGTGEQPDRGAGLPGGRDPRLAVFAGNDAADRCPPGPWTGMVLNELSCPDRSCADATDDELIGLMSRWAAQESWAVAAKLGVIRELLRRRALPGAQVRRLPGGLPDAWDEGTAHEVSAELGISLQAADKLIWLAWTLQARLPRIGAALDAGVIDYVKAKAIAEETSVLDDAHVAAAEELILAAFPLATLLGLAERPGEGHGLGPLDPALTRQLAAATAKNPHSQWCVTITDHNGYAIGHGCAKPARTNRQTRQNSQPGATPPGSQDGPWTLTRQDEPGPPGGYGTWTLTLPTGQQLTVKLGPVPVTSCDHRYESHAYQPNGILRHLVQVRDGECTFPTCSRHARESDFEHATPYDRGGRTCACNAGARSRRCHKTKQSKGWNVTQLLPGWHQWTTPSGRSYTQGPMRYPA